MTTCRHCGQEIVVVNDPNRGDVQIWVTDPSNVLTDECDDALVHSPAGR